MTASSNSDSNVSASQAGADANINQDINTPEAYKEGLVNETRSWNHNLKWLADRYGDFDAVRARDHHDLAIDRARRSMDRFDALMGDCRDRANELFSRRDELHRRGMVEYSNLQSQSNGENQRTVRHSDIAIDRIWNVDEVAAQVKEILTEDQPFKDGIAAAIVKMANSD